MTAEEAAMIMMGGGGGGSDYETAEKIITVNGYYYPPAKMIWSPVLVAVPDRYNEGYRDGVDDTLAVITGTADPMDVTDPDGGTFNFPDGAIQMPVDPFPENGDPFAWTEDFIAATGGSVTDVDSGISLVVTGNGDSIYISFVDARTGSSLDGYGVSESTGFTYSYGGIRPVYNSSGRLCCEYSIIQHNTATGEDYELIYAPVVYNQQILQFLTGGGSYYGGTQPTYSQ